MQWAVLCGCFLAMLLYLLSSSSLIQSQHQHLCIFAFCFSSWYSAGMQQASTPAPAELAIQQRLAQAVAAAAAVAATCPPASAAPGAARAALADDAAEQYSGVQQLQGGGYPGMQGEANGYGSGPMQQQVSSAAFDECSWCVPCLPACLPLLRINYAGGDSSVRLNGGDERSSRMFDMPATVLGTNTLLVLLACVFHALLRLLVLHRKLR
jgi:hypothetical protein